MIKKFVHKYHNFLMAIDIEMNFGVLIIGYNSNLRGMIKNNVDFCY